MTDTALRGRDVLRPRGFRIDKGSLFISSLGINILSLSLPVMTLQIYDRILPNPGSGTLPVLIVGVCVAIVLETILRLGRAYIIGRSGASYEHRLSCDAMNHVLQSDLSSPNPFGIGERINRIAAIGRLRDFYNGQSAITLFDLAFVPAFLGLIVYISGPLSVIPAVVLMLFTSVSFIQGKRFRKALAHRDEADDDRYNFLIESLEGIHSVKSFGLENSFSRRYEYLEERSTIANYNVTLRSARSFDMGVVFSSLMTAGVIVAGSILALHGLISAGALIATILLSGRIMQPVQRTLGLWTKYQDYTLSRQKVEGVFDIPPHPAPSLKISAAEKNGTLTFRNVSFWAYEKDAPLLQNIDVSIGRGECISLSSDNTASLSAFLDLAAGIYALQSGEIHIDNQNVLCFAPEELVNHVGYVQSEGIIFRGTIRENLTCFGRISEDKVREMASLFQVDRDIAELPSGFDTYLNGNSTDEIPPGLKQRIAMVRVLAPKPRLILFDNADRSLDRAGYNFIYNLLARLEGRATVILCSSDKNLISRATRFLHIRGGKIEEQTPPHRFSTIREMAS